MPVADVKGEVPQGFDSPTALPQSAEQARQWQEANRSWWERNSMRYDFTEKIAAPEFTREFYQEIDRRFFLDAQTLMKWNEIPFDNLIDFASLADKDVLEIGCGNGSHAQLIAHCARSYTGIDLTEYAVKSTQERMRCFGLDATIKRMDAEAMEFPDSSFDYIWSWGVIHHSADTRKILEEMRRVLRPGGRAVVMVYHRNFWSYQIFAGLFAGIFQGHLFRTGSLHKTRQKIIDGAIARYYTINEWKDLIGDLFAVKEVNVFGSKTELIPLPAGKVKNAVMSGIPNSLSRLLTSRMRMGMFLVTNLERRN